MGSGHTYEYYNIRKSAVKFAARSSRSGGPALRPAGEAATVLPGVVSHARVHRRTEGLLQQVADGTESHRLRLRSVTAESVLPRNLHVHVSRDHERHSD